MALAVAVLLAIRPISNYDTGYHLAYGEHLLTTGRIVQSNQFVYLDYADPLLGGPEKLAQPVSQVPGCAYDRPTNTWHFVNANWLSQAAMAAAHRLGGAGGLTVLQAGLVGLLLLILAAGLVRSGLSPAWMAACVLLMALASYERFDLRPEVFGYVVLAAQWFVLIGGATPKRFCCSLGGVAIRFLLQVLAVNLHSYFLMGLVLAGAVLAEACLRWIWVRFVLTEPGQPKAKKSDEKTGLRASPPDCPPAGTSPVVIAAVTFAAMALACLVNPWTWRGAIMPVQTAQYLRQYQVLGWTVEQGLTHPWAPISELGPMFAPGFMGHAATAAFIAVLALAGIAAVIGLLRRRWAGVLVLGLAAAAALQTRRNIALGAILLVPTGAVILLDAWRAWRPRRPLWPRLAPNGAVGRSVRFAGPIGIAVAASLVIISVVTQRFYFAEGRAWRFGSGFSRVMMPISAADWINRHNPPGHVFCDFADSSNLLWLTQPHRDLPVLTNTWAYPPHVMLWVTAQAAGLADLAPAARAYDINTVVLRYTANIPPLIGRLAASPDWAVVDIGIKDVTFVRRTGPAGELAARPTAPLGTALTPERLPADAAYLRRIESADAVPEYALHSHARLLAAMGWREHALTLWRRALELRPDYPAAQREYDKVRNRPW